jgi:hypothetical protein
MHGYVFPERGADGEYEVDDIQREAIKRLIAFLDRHLKN